LAGAEFPPRAVTQRRRPLGFQAPSGRRTSTDAWL